MNTRRIEPVALTCLAALMAASFCIGTFPLSLSELWTAVAAKLSGQTAANPTVDIVLWQIRAPRVVAGVLVGAGLAAAGASYQAMFRNPLASPDILGVSSGASLGAVVGIFLDRSVLAIQTFAFIGGLAAVAAVYGIGLAIRHRDNVLTLVLAGVAIGSLLGAAISLLKILADPYNQLPSITYWLLGSLSAVTNGDVAAAAGPIVAGAAVLCLLRWRMNLMTLSDEEAKALGVPVGLLRAVFVVAATLITSAAVSITGIVGWIGLVMPHIARLLVGPNFARLLPASLLLGGAFLVGIDILARTVAAIEVPLGILTACIGAPFFLWLLATARPGWR
jgi:iron complex transport system permease protein